MFLHNIIISICLLWQCHTLGISTIIMNWDVSFICPCVFKYVMFFSSDVFSHKWLTRFYYSVCVFVCLLKTWQWKRMMLNMKKGIKMGMRWDFPCTRHVCTYVYVSCKQKMISSVKTFCFKCWLKLCGSSLSQRNIRINVKRAQPDKSIFVFV